MRFDTGKSGVLASRKNGFGDGVEFKDQVVSCRSWLESNRTKTAGPEAWGRACLAMAVI